LNADLGVKRLCDLIFISCCNYL